MIYDLDNNSNDQGENSKIPFGNFPEATDDGMVKVSCPMCGQRYKFPYASSIAPYTCGHCKGIFKPYDPSQFEYDKTNEIKYIKGTKASEDALNSYTTTTNNENIAYDEEDRSCIQWLADIREIVTFALAISGMMGLIGVVAYAGETLDKKTGSDGVMAFIFMMICYLASLAIAIICLRTHLTWMRCIHRTLLKIEKNTRREK